MPASVATYYMSKLRANFLSRMKKCGKPRKYSKIPIISKIYNYKNNPETHQNYFTWISDINRTVAAQGIRQINIRQKIS
jgi:hypothetical protein